MSLAHLMITTVLVSSALAACSKPEEGACVLVYETRDECLTGKTEELCTELAKPSDLTHAKSGTFERPNDEDRAKYENVKMITPDITALTCRRLGFMRCSLGTCSRR